MAKPAFCKRCKNLEFCTVQEDGTEMKPKIAKAHSKRHAREFVRLGWTLQTEFRAHEDDEPYEYFFVWEKDEDPRPPNKDPKAWPQTDILPEPRVRMQTL
jgi:hypothetical protein